MGNKMTLLTDVEAVIAGLQTTYNQLKNDDGVISVGDLWQLVQLAVQDLVVLSNDLAASADKEALILEAFGQVYDQFLSTIPLNGIPAWLEPILSRALRPLFMELVTGVINFLLGKQNTPSA